MSERLLTIRNLQVEGVASQRQTILHGIDLHIDRGEVLGIIGESGAGKSTLGLAAMYYSRTGCRIAGGSIVFDGRDLHTLVEAELRELRGSRIAYVAQSAAASFNPAHRLLTQCIEPSLEHGLFSPREARKCVTRLYAQLALPPTIGTRYPHQVSGGQLQRAMLAMAMAGRPELIIFDEPTAALDATTQIAVLVTIKKIIRSRSAAALYISHDLALVAQLADRIAVLRHGRVVEEGSTPDILNRAQRAYTRRLLATWRRRTVSQSRRPSSVVLECQNLRASYRPGTPVLDNLSFCLQRGKTVAMVGESGSGKSTLARVVSGLLPTQSGLVIFDGQPLPTSYTQRSRDTLRRVQLISQMPDVALNPRHTIARVLGRPVEFYFGLRGRVRQKRVAELLDMIELPAAFAGRRTTELSGGQKQRLCIARALAARPDVVVCDEVTSALDPVVAEGIVRLLQGLQKALGLAYLFISHDVSVVKSLADEVLVLHQGRIVERGPVREVLTRPQHAYTERLVASVPELDPRWLTEIVADLEDG